MISPEQYLIEFDKGFMCWDSFQGNEFKSQRESWVVANFLRTYNKAYGLNYSLPNPRNDTMPDIQGCCDNLNNKMLDFEVGEVLFNGIKRANKYKGLTKSYIREIESNPKAVNIVKKNMLDLLRKKLLRDYGKHVFLLLYFNPGCDAGEELFFDKDKIIEDFIKENDVARALKGNRVFQEIWLLTGRQYNGYSQIICIYPTLRILKGDIAYVEDSR